MLRGTRYEIFEGDCVESLKALPDGCVHMCVTSPPYYGLRSYGVGAEGGEIGLEQTPQDFVARLVEVFREVKRVLRDDGTLWLNIGDSYANDTKWGGSSGGKHAEALHGNTGIGRGRKSTGLKPKDLIGIPWRVAFALQDDGWFLRQDIIWHKGNCLPESVKDRCTKAHEYVFLLSKSKTYYFDVEAIKEPAVRGYAGSRFDKGRTAKHQMDRASTSERTEDGLRNKRSVWNVNTKPFRGAHFAVFPEDLVEPCILAGTSAGGVCKTCGAPKVRALGRPCEACEAMIPTQGKSCPACGHVRDWKKGRETSQDLLATDWSTPGKGTPRLPGGFENKTVTTGWQASCGCEASDTAPAVVLDPFGGSGTTAVVALRHGRNAILCELNSEYAKMAESRIEASDTGSG